ncbi:Diphthamide biosynthesis protein 1 [Venturia nashicola]|nr:Diphthamide biosynthesis protein 1 [Venturia nashicola]
MVEWRDQGFVQDSDDEEETIETQSTTRLENEGQLEPQQILAEREDGNANGNLGLEEIVEKELESNKVEGRTCHEVEDTGETCHVKRSGDRGVGRQGSHPEDDIPKEKEGHILGAAVQQDRGIEDDDIDELALSPIHQNRRQIQTPTPEPEENQDLADDIWHLIGSSPLSEPPRTPTHASPSPSVQQRDTGSIRREELTSSSTRQYVEVRIPYREPSVQIEDAPRSERQRNFRERKAIQLHPYQIDKIRYEKDMRSRGVKPVRIAMSSPQRKAHAEKSHEEEESQLSRNSQSSTAEESSVSEGNGSTPRDGSPRSSSPISGSSPPRLSGPNEDEELPELSELLKKRPFEERTPQGGGKRRKVTHQYSRKHKPSNAPMNIVTAAPPDPNDDTLMAIDPDDIFEFPDSPRQLPPIPPSQSGDGRLRIPPPISPLRRSIQAISSGKKAQNSARRVSSVDGTPAPTRRRKHTVTIQSPIRDPVEVEDSSSSESDVDTTEEIKAVKKRIKGVLPASWLKLDLKSREKNLKARPTSPRRPVYPQEDEATHRGVAKRTMRTGPRARSPLSPIPVFSDADLDESDAETPLPNFGQLSDDDNSPLPLKISSMPISTLFDDDPGENMEDNSIDRMAPSTSRVRVAKGAGRKRQIKLKDAFNHSSKRLKTGASLASSMVPELRTRRIEVHKQKRKRKASAPKLSVIDVLDDSTLSGPIVPQFLKIAAREARRRPDSGRQSLTNKHIRLQTRQDTQDTNSVLRDWQAGKIQSRPTKGRTRPPTRPPLGERSNNSRLEDTDRTSGQPGIRPQIVVRRQGALQQIQLHSAAKAPIAHKQGTTRSILSRPKQPWRLPSRSKPIHTAQLEMDEEEPSAPQDLSSFEMGLRNREFNQMFRSSAPSIDSLTSRIGKLQWSDANQPPTPSKSVSHASTMQKANTAPKRRLQRKRHTHRVDVDMSEYRQPEDFIPPSSYISERLDTPVVDQAVLQDLSPFGVPYTKDFDILPLPIGTHFHQSTFIGSGDFSRALSIDRNLDTYNGNHVLFLEGKSHIWGQWNEDMASAVHDIFHSISTHIIALDWTSGLASNLELSNAAKVVQRLINANADGLSFSDPIDREACFSRFLECVQPMHTATIEHLEATASEKRDISSKAVIVHLATLQIALLQQLLSMCGSHSNESTRKQAIAHLKSLCGASLRWLTRNGFEEVRTFFVQNSRHAVSEAGIQEDHAAAAVESLVVMLHVLETQQLPNYSFWDAFNAITLISVPHTTRVGTLERAWYNMFTILPLAELDSRGVLNVGHRFTKSFENWSGVTTVISRVFALYSSTSTTAGSTINDYMRSLLVRCWQLIKHWSWRKCETIIGVIFDFFARNNLAPLRNEITHGSPQFLEDLHSNASLEVGPEDKSFHIFLKIVAVGLRGMYGMYPDKRIQSIAWRCIPNHGRIYHKDQEIKQDDLDALRNHHDLLCTLYWASPPGFRPRVDLIQHLVDHASSHREACRLNIKAWTNLAQFQLSTGESLQSNASFASWFNDVVEQTIAQFKLARTEAEAQFEAANKAGEVVIPQDLLDSTISRNQSQVLSSLSEAISGLRSVLKIAAVLPAASDLLRGSGVERVLTLFDPQNFRPNSAITECLLTYQAYSNKVSEELNSKETSQTTSEESQDYGDWPEPEAEGTVTVSRKDAAPIDFIFEPVAQLLSNCFGAEKTPDETLLNLVVDLWANLAWSTVQRGHYGWESFLDEHGSHAWGQLRDTEQRRKYGPCFLSHVSNLDPTTLDTYRTLFLSLWMSSLVERDAQLKFQHRLTNGILNHFPHDSLLRDLPFIEQTVDGAIRFDVTLNELRDRRLGLISSILSNMHDLFNENHHHQTALRREYTPYLRQLMSSMKTNYTALQHHGENMTGAYVIFVQRIVEFLQQYTSDICPVDKFFTDSVIFPLPANDPLYVVGKLKGYTAKLGDAKEVRRLAGFFQSVSERAAVDNEQQYLVEQLQEGLSGELKSGSLSLKTVLMQAIFPTYLESSFTTEVGWIVAKPVLIACANTFDDLIYDVRFDDISSVEAALKIMESILAVLPRVIRDLGDRPELFSQPHALSTLSATLNVVTATMPSIDYINRRSDGGEAAIRSVGYFRSFSVFAAKILMGVNDAFAPVLQGDEAAAGSEYDEIKQFCARELHRDLANWKVEEGRYSVKRGTRWKEVAVSLRRLEEEREGLMHSIEEFHTVLARMQFGRCL